MTALRKRMLEELQRRNYSPTTARAYLYAVEEFARYFRKSPDELDQEQLRQYQLHLLHDRKLTIGTIVGRIAALRFFFVAAPSSILTPFCISWHANLVGRSQMSVAGVIKFVPVAHHQCDRPPELAFSQSWLTSKMFREQAYQDPSNARQQAARSATTLSVITYL